MNERVEDILPIVTVVWLTPRVCHDPPEYLTCPQCSQGMTVELGVDTFRRRHLGRAREPSVARAWCATWVEEGVLADQVGLNFIGLGEHHRDDFAVSSPEMVVAAIAARTENIHLGSAVTVLSSDDPCACTSALPRWMPYSTGARKSSWAAAPSPSPLHCSGYELEDYEDSSRKKLALFTQLRAGQPVSWAGKHTRIWTT